MAETEAYSSEVVEGLQPEQAFANPAMDEKTDSDGQMDQVKFIGVRPAYPPGESIKVLYCVGDEVEVTAHDWVGVYKVGWSSPKNDYFTFVWSPPTPSEGTEQSVSFAPRYLPKDQEFYQFCYVTKVGDIRGVSSPFQIRNDYFSDDDIVCVELEDEAADVVLVQTRERRAREQETESRLADLQTTVASLQVAEEDWKERTEVLKQQKHKLSEEKDRACAQIAEIESKIASYLQEIDLLRKEKAKAVDQNQQSVKMVADIETRLASVVHKLDVSGSEVAVAIQERERLESELTEKKASIDELKLAFEDTVKILASTSTQLEAAQDDNCRLTDTIQHFEKEIGGLKQELEQRRSDTECLHEALEIANARKAADDELLQAKETHIDELHCKLVEADAGQLEEMARLYTENGKFRESVETSQRLVENLQGELAALRLSAEEMESETQRVASRVDESHIVHANMAELIGENNALKRDNEDLAGKVTELTQLSEENAALESEKMAQLREEMAELREVYSSRVGGAAMFGLRRAFEDAQRQCEEAHAANRQQVRVTRAAESTVKTLEDEVESLNELVKMLKGKLQEGAEHYRSKYRECAQLKRKLEEMVACSANASTDSANIDLLEENSELRVALMEAEASASQKCMQLDECESELERLREDNERLRRESCRQLMQSLHLENAQPAQTLATAAQAAAAPLAPQFSAASGPEVDARVCPICSLELPWDMAIEEVNQHCASHFESVY
ncbi:tax1-binding protein 1 homolog [Sycon ciliatum]|uniref:tax1-binding protein 1 homolog n=1 Tax=Sycon ciliatum TaxID=27933 RepID=UPI0031F5F5FD